jgi:peptide chain release factor 2
LGKERASLESIVHTIETLDTGVADAGELLEMAASEDDEATVEEISTDIDGLLNLLDELEFRRMFSGEMDPNNAFLDIQAGSGGTEAQDWAEMLLRMYLRWGDAKGFKTVGCAQKRVCTGWFENRLLTPGVGVIPHLHRYSCPPKLMTILKLK